MSADDPTRDEARPFAGDTASFYARYRRAYPAEFIARLADLGCGRQHRLLDLGCGTGTLLLQLASFFDRAMGLDPEPDMRQPWPRPGQGRHRLREALKSWRYPVRPIVARELAV